MDVKSYISGCRNRYRDQMLNSRELRVFSLEPGSMLDAAELDRIHGESCCIRQILPALITPKPQAVKLLDHAHQSSSDLSEKLECIAEGHSLVRRLHGRWELAVGYPMLEGRFSDGTFVRAPVFLFPIQLEKTPTHWELSKLYDGPATVNPALAEAAAAAEVGPAHLSADAVRLTSAWSAMQQAQTAVAQLGIQAELPETTGEVLQDISEYDPGDPPAYAYDEFRLQSSMVIGRFSHEAAVFHRAFTDCLEAGVMHEQAEQLFVSQDPGEHRRLDVQPIDENRSCAAAPLDVSQHQAVQAASMHHSAVVAGAPGTGKTQVMINCIAEYLAHGKKVLMVSPNRTARDDACSRLAQLGISEQVVHVSDIRADRDGALDAVEASITAHEVPPDSESFELESSRLKQEYLELSHDIEKKTAKLDGVYQALRSTAPCGKTLYELYIAADSDDALLIRELVEKWEVYGQLDQQQMQQLEQLYLRILPRLSYNFPGQSAVFRVSFQQAQDDDREAWINSIDTALTELGRISDARPFSEQWAQHQLLSGDDPAVRCRELLGMIEQLQRELKLAQLLPAEELGDVSEGKELLQILQRTHAWKPAFWRALKSMKRRKPKKSPLFTYSRKLRYSLHIADRLQQLQQIFDKPLPYDDIPFAESQLEVFKQSVEQYRDIWNCLLELKGCLQEEKLRELFVQGAAGDVQESITYLEQLQQLVSEQFDEIAELDRAVAEAAEPLQHAVQALMKHCSCDQEQLEQQGLTVLKNTLWYCQLQYMEHQAAEVLTYLDQAEELTEQIRTDAKEKQELIPRLVKRRVDLKICSILEKSWQAFELRDALRNSRQEMTLESFVGQSLEQGLLELVPCWVASPEAAAVLFPQKQFFDLLLFDEASFLEADQAIPLMNMAESVLTAGDPVPSDHNLLRESLYQIAERSFDTIPLQAHYRSEDERLFAFPNAEFYQHTLLTSPSVSVTDSPISLIIPKSRSAGASAAEALISLLDSGCGSAAVAVCTEHQKQQVRDAVRAVLAEDSRYSDLLKSESDYLYTTGELSGESRDGAVFLPDLAVIAADSEGSVLKTALSCAGRHLAVIVPEESEEEQSTETEGILRWYRFLRFAGQLGSDESAAINQLSRRTAEAGELAEQVYEALRSRGLQVEKQVGFSPCTVDVAVFDPQQQRYVLGILCDSPDMLQAYARDAEIWKRQFLESRGWNIHRVWCRNWWRDASRETAAILSRVKSAQQLF